MVKFGHNVPLLWWQNWQQNGLIWLKKEKFCMFKNCSPIWGYSRSESKLSLDSIKPCLRSDSGHSQIREKCHFTKTCPIFAKMDNFEFLKLLHQPIVIVYHTTKNCRNRSNQLWVMAFHTWICDKNQSLKSKCPQIFSNSNFDILTKRAPALDLTPLVSSNKPLKFMQHLWNLHPDIHVP